jgi:hypothetical protein
MSILFIRLLSVTALVTIWTKPILRRAIVNMLITYIMHGIFDRSSENRYLYI